MKTATPVARTLVLIVSLGFGILTSTLGLSLVIPHQEVAEAAAKPKPVIKVGLCYWNESPLAKNVAKNGKKYLGMQNYLFKETCSKQSSKPNDYTWESH